MSDYKPKYGHHIDTYAAPLSNCRDLDNLELWLRRGGAARYGVSDEAACFVADAVQDRAWENDHE